MSKLMLGIDIGGTFTDVVAYVEDTQNLIVTKVPSLPTKPDEAFMNGVRKILEMIPASPGEVERIIYGSTIATNALLEHKGANLGILTTEGFEDLLSIGTTFNTQMYTLLPSPETPTFLCPRRRIFGIPERVSVEGEVLVPLDEDKVAESARILRDKYGVTTIMVLYLHCYVNSRHEIRTKEIINELYPELNVTLSSAIDPKWREYERLVITAFDGYVENVVVTHLKEVKRKLKNFGIKAPLQVMKSRGAVCGVDVGSKRPVELARSGPAAGVISAREVGQMLGLQNLITLDIGGTSCDVALVREGKAQYSTRSKIDKYPLRLPMIDIETIGAGGGSIAYLDEAGGFRVGPQSAGADPGPACYGQGGDQPTITDASVVLGYLSPDYLAGGEIILQPSLATKAIKEKIADRLCVDVRTAAIGIHRIVNSNMAQTIKLVTVKHGYDPRNFTLVAFGGAGPVHASQLAKELSIPQVIIPTTPGVLSAFGLLFADIEHEFAKTYQVLVKEAKPQELMKIFDEIEQDLLNKMRVDGVPESLVTFHRFAEMRYVRQGFELEVAFPNGHIDAASIAEMAERFHKEHERVYGHCHRQDPVEFIDLRTVCSWSPPKPTLPRSTVPREAATLKHAQKGTRKVYFEEYHDYVETPIFERHKLPVNQEIISPAIVEQADTTTVIYPGDKCRLDMYGNLIITITKKSPLSEEATKKESGIAGEEIDPVTLEVLRGRFDTIANEMQETMTRSAYSTIVREMADCSSALFDRRGRILAQAVAIPMHLGMMPPIVKSITQVFPIEQMKPGDSYITNDPYQGGTHIPDLIIVTPIFFKDKVVALSVTFCHHQDLGGCMPASTPAEVTEIYAEGLIIPPSKLYDQGTPNETLHNIMRRNVRVPDMLFGDIGAQRAAAYVAERRMLELLEEYEEGTIQCAIDQLMGLSERLTRDKLEQIPDGRYSFHDFVDEDSIDHDTPIKIQATVEIKGSDLYIDFEGTAPQAKGPINMVYATSMAPCCYLIRAITDPTIPNNEGCYRALHVNFPKGSLVNPNPPAPVGIRANPAARTVEVLLGALIQIMPDRIPASGSHYVGVEMIGGTDTKTGGKFVSVLPMPFWGGAGGQPNKDGIDQTAEHLHNATRIDIEPAEANYPLRILKFSHRQDSAGAGKYRGGLGGDAICLWLGGEAKVNHRIEKRVIPAWGVFGGEPGLKHETIIMRKDGKREILPSMCQTYLSKGDQLHVLTSGGGGYGDPLERSPEKVLDDVLDKKVSLGAAREKYGVVIDAEKMTIDSQATLELREYLRQAKGKSSQIFDRGHSFV